MARLKARSDQRSKSIFRRLSARIGKDFSVTDDGRLKAGALSHGEVYGLLSICVRTEGYVTSGALRSAFAAGIKEALITPIELAEFADIADRALQKGLQASTQRFAMWSDLNIHWPSETKSFSLKIDDATVYCGSRLPKFLRGMSSIETRNNAVFS